MIENTYGNTHDCVIMNFMRIILEEITKKELPKINVAADNWVSAEKIQGGAIELHSQQGGIMELIIQDFYEISNHYIRMTEEEWNRAKGLDKEGYCVSCGKV